MEELLGSAPVYIWIEHILVEIIFTRIGKIFYGNTSTEKNPDLVGLVLKLELEGSNCHLFKSIILKQKLII